MKRTLKILIACLLLSSFANAQTFPQTIPQKVKDKTRQRADSKVDQGIDKGLDKTEQTIGNVFKKKKKKTTAAADSTITGQTTVTTTPDNGNQTNTNTTITTTSSNNSPKSSNSFSDFTPGGNVIFADDFSQDALNDFPAGWNTNGSGKVVTIDGVQGRWLEMVHNTVVNPVLKKQLPENCTVEFDLFLQSPTEHSIPVIIFGLTPVKNILKEDVFGKDKFYTSISRYNESDGKTIEYGLRDAIGNKNDFPILSYNNKVLHVSMAINKTRVRVYFDKTKLIDLPMALTAEMLHNFFFCNGYVVPASETGMFIGNISIASADVDARSLLVKDLLEKGKASTNEILFDVNKDIIKRESFDIINQIGEALKSNPSLKIKIIGHTDADGTAADNLSLSKRRASAVSSYLINNYSIDESRIASDGKGATQPVADNKTAEGKAKNRRVEFIKI